MGVRARCQMQISIATTGHLDRSSLTWLRHHPHRGLDHGHEDLVRGERDRSEGEAEGALAAPAGRDRLRYVLPYGPLHIPR